MLTENADDQEIRSIARNTPQMWSLMSMDVNVTFVLTPFSLKTAVKRYCNEDLDKSVRGKIIWSKTLTSDIIIYGAQDVKYLEQIREKQLIELRKKDLVVALAYENKFCPVLAYTEFCGAKLDEEK